MATRRVVLASASPARLRLLRQAGIEPEVDPSDVDEDGVALDDPASLVLELAILKARAVASRHPDAIVVGCDSLLDVDGVAHGKPADLEEARARLERLAGRTAVLRTGHCVIDTAAGREASAVESTVVRFGTWSPAELDAYLATGEALAVAGSFTLDGRSAPFVEGIDGDPSNVIGLSLPRLRQLLSELDVAIVDLWS